MKTNQKKKKKKKQRQPKTNILAMFRNNGMEDQIF